ncbi:MAG TPA: hypothetical protein IAA62_03150 [Candidatus Caccopulliclostridium gallistercoris]|uniref:Uncharacterized protein n=1 Tax=Candidatus Caccopulliclostridium gallistercoris TaxID=2840719 RepID=A0A9D1NFD1_9FIRM|nr:hypothetical protein [Candidatus Caccopulliclostridium gallistercoris]
MKKFKTKKQISTETQILFAKNAVIQDVEKAKKLAKFINDSNAINPSYESLHFNDGTSLGTILPANTFYYSLLNIAFFDYIDKNDSKLTKAKKIAKAALFSPLMAVGAAGAIVLDLGLYVFEGLNAIIKAPKFLIRKLAYKRLEHAKKKLNILKAKINKNAYFIELNDKEVLNGVKTKFSNPEFMLKRLKALKEEKEKNALVPVNNTLTLAQEM